MKMPKEYVLVLIVGLFLLAYLLEAVVDPLALPLSTPYQFLTSEYIAKVPFTTAVIAVRSLAVFLTPLWLLSFISGAFQFKAVTLLVVSVLLQLYGVQATASSTVGIPLEWAISFAFGGLVLFLPMLFFFAKGAVGGKPPQSPADLGSLADDDDDD
jgi:hypothetical protein